MPDEPWSSGWALGAPCEAKGPRLIPNVSILSKCFISLGRKGKKNLGGKNWEHADPKLLGVTALGKNLICNAWGLNNQSLGQNDSKQLVFKGWGHNYNEAAFLQLFNISDIIKNDQ